jgi:hypothetical protein
MPFTFTDYLCRFGPLVPPSPAFEDWLRRNDVPPPVADVFRRGVIRSYHVPPAEQPDYHDWLLFDEAGLMAQNRSAADRPMRDGLLVFASGPDGTLVAADLSGNVGAVGYVNHERYWHAPDLMDEYVEVAGSLDAYAELVDRGGLPCDYCDAWKKSG